MYSIAQNPLRINVYDKFSRQPIAGSKVHLQDLNTMREFDGVCSDEGFCIFNLPPAVKYRIDVAAPSGRATDDYMAYSYVLTSKELNGRSSFNIELERIKRAEQGLLPAIYYEKNQSELSAENETALKGLVQMLASFPSMQIQIGIYSECRESNAMLSKRTAALKKYVTEKEIDKQVTVKEFGNVRPQNQCNCENKNAGCTEDKYKENRRAEFKVVSF